MRGAFLAIAMRLLTLSHPRTIRIAVRFAVALSTAVPALALERPLADVEHPAHAYWDRPPRDAFTQKISDLHAGKIPLDSSGTEKAFLTSLLKALDVPASSQLLVFSSTSLQQPRISVRNPRAIYFNENLYVGWVPRGQIEVVAIDPDLGGVFYIFDIPRREGETIEVERSDRCMNCHARSLTGGTPGLTIKSVIPGPNGGSLDAFRLEVTGHGVPLADRFGGWHVTGVQGATEHKGNLIGQYREGEVVTESNLPGQRFDLSKYPVATSDILVHLVFEHEIGFNNRAIEANYAARAFLFEDRNTLTEARKEELAGLADGLVRYLLFADEVPLPEGGIEGDPAFVEDFRKNRRPNSEGLSLRDFDLKTRLFAHRCSYMIHSVAFQGLHPLVKAQVMQGLRAALEPEGPEAFRYLPLEEKARIRTILSETLEGFAG